MRKTVWLLTALVSASLTTSCATRPACREGCPEWVRPASAPRPGEVLDLQRKKENAVHNRNIRCFCLGQREYCAK